MTAARQALMNVAQAEYFGWKQRTGEGYAKGARHFATEILGPRATKKDIDYLSGRFHRWETAEKKRRKKEGAPAIPSVADAFAAALPTPRIPVVQDDTGPELKTLADLAVEGSEEDWLIESLRQIEHAVAMRLMKGSDITGIKRLAADLRRQLETIRKPPTPDIGDLPAEEREALLTAEVPGWPTYVLVAAAEELERRGEE